MGIVPIGPKDIHEKIIAIIVTFNPDERLSKNINSLLTQVDQIIVIDNGSRDTGLSILKNLNQDVIIIYNKSNVGLATALNQGVRLALNKNPYWVITFDQDSIAPEGFVNSLITAYSTCSFMNEIAIVGPVYQDQVTGQFFSMREPRSSNSCQEVLYTWTSGCLIKASIFTIVGYFRDEFFIDSIDVEYCLRCQKYGFKVIEAPTAILSHNQGVPTWKQFLGKRIVANNYSPLRRYYSARNRTVVYLEYMLLQPKWVIRDIFLYLRQLANMLILEDNRWLKLFWVLRGVKDGLLKRGGMYSTDK